MFLRLSILTGVLLGLFTSCSNQDAKIKKEVYTQDILVDVTKPQRPMNLGAVERKVHELINQYRQKKGLRPFKRLSVLDESSRSHSRYMSVRSGKSDKTLVVSHDKFNKRMKVLMGLTPATGLAENVAGLEKVREAFVAERLVDGWIRSPGHHKNIVGDYTSAGIGVVEGSGYTVFATQIFARLPE